MIELHNLEECIVSWIAAVLAGVASLAPGAQDDVLIFEGARLMPVSSPVIDDGVLVVHAGKIVAVGSRDDVRVPEGGVRFDLSGKTLIPGLVCTHSHIGGGRGGDRSAPIQPDVRILDSLNVRDSGFRRALAGGLTTLNIMPGSGHLLSGQTSYVKLRAGDTIEDLLIRDDEDQPLGGMKMANGTNSIRDKPFPGTRGKSAALVRAKLIRAREYRDKLARAAADPEQMPERDLGLEALAEVLSGTRVVPPPHAPSRRHRHRPPFGRRVWLPRRAPPRE